MKKADADDIATTSLGGGCWARSISEGSVDIAPSARCGLFDNLLQGIPTIRRLCDDAARSLSEKALSCEATRGDVAPKECIVSPCASYLACDACHPSKRRPSDPLWPAPFWHGLDLQGKDWQWLREAHERVVDLAADPPPQASPCTMSLTADGLCVTYVGDVVDGLPHGYGVAFYRYAFETQFPAWGWSEGLWMGGARYALLSCAADGWHSLMDAPAIDSEPVAGTTSYNDGRRTEAFWHDSILASINEKAFVKCKPGGLPYLWTAVAKTPSPPLFDINEPHAVALSHTSHPSLADDDTPTATLMALPGELLVAILAHVDGFALGRFSATCRAAAVLADDDRVWASVFCRSFGLLYDDLLSEFAWAIVDTKGYPLPFSHAAATGRSWRWLFVAHTRYYDPANPRSGPCILDADHYMRPYLAHHGIRETNPVTFVPPSPRQTIYIGDVTIDNCGYVWPCGYGVMITCRGLPAAARQAGDDRVPNAFERLAHPILSARDSWDDLDWCSRDDCSSTDPAGKKLGLLSWREIVIPSYDHLAAGFSIGLLSRGSRRGHVYIGESPSARGGVARGLTLRRKYPTSAILCGLHRSGKPFGRHDYASDDGVRRRVWWTGGGAKSRHMPKDTLVLPDHPHIRKTTINRLAVFTMATTYHNGDRLVLYVTEGADATLTCSSSCPDPDYASRIIHCTNVVPAPAIDGIPMVDQMITGVPPICVTGDTDDDRALVDYIRRGLMGWGPAHDAASMAFQAHITDLLDQERRRTLD
ncbi:F-box domain containing protein [Pandoravirus quercus]|uniref:F-box domain containing protein n=1 Tax=Pandoravirus quercus TaxID=2107709 RepID=A0A2U7U9G7_9VIRU|nr:F-box domain containing protein [Pandoravirus quercus]AVK75074.1 F-box domain containing protein [Pandoravirus quercus]